MINPLGEHIQITGVLEVEKGGGAEKTFQEINSDNIIKLMKSINLHIKEVQQDQSRKKNSDIHLDTYIQKGMPKGNAKRKCLCVCACVYVHACIHGGTHMWGGCTHT